MPYVNKIIDRAQTEYDIHDGRLPVATPEDAGKVVAVGADGNMSFEQASGGGGMVETTWSQLKALRDAGQLVPGTQYKITDYVTSTGELNTHSGNHQFDLVVVADTESSLNETARACSHDGDTYFAGCDLGAWHVEYCIDNDQTKFSWADPVTGKGVIYRLVDEFGNDLPYDFKNIIYDFVPSFNYNQWGTDYEFKRNASLDADGYFGWSCDATPSGWSSPNCYTSVETPTTDMTLYSDTAGTVISMGGTITSVNTTEKSMYTFTRIVDSVVSDGSLVLDSSNHVIGNFVAGFISSGLRKLPWNVFGTEGSILQVAYNHLSENCRSNTLDSICSNNWFSHDCVNNELGQMASDNRFGYGCKMNCLGGNSRFNSFGENCSKNSLSMNCQSNSFGDNCNSNVFGDGCSNNSFGHGCYNNTFGNSCNSNLFENNCTANTFGNSCVCNDFANNCSGNTFGDNSEGNCFEDNCSNNTMGATCYRNTFEGKCDNNTFGDYFMRNRFGSNSGGNKGGSHIEENEIGAGSYSLVFGSAEDALTDYVKWVIIDPGCCHLNIFSTDTTASSSNWLQNVHVHLGVTGVYYSKVDIEIPDRALAYETNVVKTGTTDINV